MKLIVFLLYFYLALFPFGQLVRLPFPIPEVNLYLTDIAVAGLGLSWLGWRLIKKRKFNAPPLSRPIFLFVGAAFLSLAVNSPFRVNFQGEPLLSGREVGVAGLYLIRWVFYAGIYFVVFDLAKEIKNLKLEITNLLIGAGIAAAVFGLIQYLFLPDTRFLESFGWDPHYYRLLGTFLDPGFLGAILVLALSLLTVKLWSWEKLSWWLVAWPILYLGLALTYSRASFLAYLGTMGVISWAKKSPKFFLGVLVAGVITVLLLPRPGGEGVRLERESTIKFRIINWQQSLTIAKDHPILGVGFNAYRYAQRKYGFLEEKYQISHAGAGADSSFLFVLATSGILGLLAYLWLWLTIIRSANSIIILASTTALLIHSLFLNSLFYPWIMAWLWILLARGETKEQK